jgi:hypothetical protein
MPKRGATLPWRVVYVYPPSDRAPEGIKGAEAHYDADRAAMFANQVAERGASGTVSLRQADGTYSEVCTFTAKAKAPDDE